ncbi:ANTAR domain-containing response regulator [Phreatobacter sp. AB_2022a]|uniref:ANTAR domain-containing response regulator n=1 Tax=Phreatobacter sp. AB_2022a TaxID=3003134 RepID=UPI002286CF48|nr:ANTAR domain-containing protein [Phreatobacter sp. AB_2022a]MCZ0737409.1 ANTAR domain-containing protein [Phreatobacter sp. AB_2022a]
MREASLADHILTTAIVSESSTHAATIAAGLGEAGHNRIVRLETFTNLFARLREIRPDRVVIALDNPARDLLEQLFEVAKLIRRPVVLFVDRSPPGMTERAVAAGIAAYVVDGLGKERIRPVLDLAMARFEAQQRLEAELAEARAALEARKLVDRAKGLLMKHKGISEEEAYAQLRRRAMNEKRKIGEIAAAVVTGLDMLG